MQIVVTGANSVLGAFLVEDIVAHTDWSVTALISPRAARPDDRERVTYLRGDLTHPLTAETTQAFRNASSVVHFAWARSITFTQSVETNGAIVDSILQELAEPARFLFISSIAASPNAISTYASSKYLVGSRVLGKGGNVLVCGLATTDPPRGGSYAMLHKIVRATPVSFRLFGDPLFVYPITLPRIAALLRATCATVLPSGTYRLYEDGVEFNAFMCALEKHLPRTRVPVWIPRAALLRGTALAKRLGVVPVKLADQVLTFFYKDSAYIQTHRVLESEHA